MNSMWSDYYFARGEVFVILILIGGVGAAICWALRMRWRNRLKTLEHELAGARAKYDREYFRTLHNHLQSAVAHEVVKGLDYISNQSVATLEGLAEEQHVLRGKQHAILAKTYELEHRAKNILAMLAPEGHASQKELLNVRRVIEHVLQGLYLYGESEGVTLMPDLEDVEPTVLDRDATCLILENLIHNSIKYSFRGGVVQITLALERDEDDEGQSRIYVEVKDTGRGIPEEHQGTLFQLRWRGDGLIEPGSGLGLYLAREAARRQSGDVILVRSHLNEGSVFRVTFPASNLDFER